MSTMAITIPHNFNPRDYQLALFKAGDSGISNRFLLRWCRRAGKDKTCINFICKKALERVGAYFYIFPSYAQARKALWEGRDMDGFRFLDHIPEEIRDHSTPSHGVNNNEMKITLLNGSIIRLVGSENFDSLMGTNPLGLVFSEFALQDVVAWQFLEPILLQNGGWALFNGTPRGKNHMFDLEARNLSNREWYISEVQTLWPDLPNYYPVVTLEDIDRARQAGMTEEVIEQEFGASYIAGSKGNYYSDQIIAARESGRIGKYPYNDQMYVDTFWDLGYTDDTSIWFKQCDGNANIFIDYYENNTKDLAHYIEAMRDKGYRFRTHYLPHDAKGGKFQSGLSHRDVIVRLCQQAGIASDCIIAPKVNSKQMAIDAVRSRFSSYYFNEQTCGEAIVKLSLYHRKWDRFKQVFMDAPVHDWCSHAADSLTTEALTGSLQMNTISSYSVPKIKTDFDPLA